MPGPAVARLLRNPERSESRALISAMTVVPRGSRRHLIDLTIRALIAQDLWAKLDILYFLAAHDEQAARLNWKNPGTLTCTNVNSVAFTADRGFAGDGATSYLDTGYNPTTGGLQFAQNNAHMGRWCYTDLDSVTAVNVCGNSSAALAARNGTTLGVRACASTSDVPAHDIATSVGHALWSRAVSTGFDSYVNGGGKITSTRTSTAMVNANFAIGGRLGGTTLFSTVGVSAFHAGTLLTDNDVSALYAIALAYMQGVGAAS